MLLLPFRTTSLVASSCPSTSLLLLLVFLCCCCCGCCSWCYSLPVLGIEGTWTVNFSHFRDIAVAHCLSALIPMLNYVCLFACTPSVSHVICSTLLSCQIQMYTCLNARCWCAGAANQVVMEHCCLCTRQKLLCLLHTPEHLTEAEIQLAGAANHVDRRQCPMCPLHCAAVQHGE